MAYKKKVYGRAYPHMYNVNMTVGSRKSISKTQQMGTQPVNAGRINMSVPSMKTTTIYKASNEPNRRDDVMLVQYLLKRVYQEWEKRGEPSKGISLLKIDGMYGPQTQRAIEQFQLDVARSGRSIATDGCVDSERGDTAYSSISRTGYTISWLNSTLWMLNPSLASDITRDPECPYELKQAITCDGSV